MFKRAKYKKLLVLVLLSFTSLLWYTSSFSHFKLNANIRLYHVVHEDGQIRLLARMPLAYLIADKLGSIQEDGLPAPAPYSTNLLIDDILNHKLDAATLREDPKGLGQFFADGTIIKISDKELKPVVGRVVAYPLNKQKPFSTLNEAESSLSSDVYNSDYKEAFIGDTIIDIELVYSTNKKIKKYTIQSLLNPGLPKQEETANLIIDHRNKKPNIYRITGLLDKSVNITNSAIKAFSTFVVNGFIHILEGYDHILFILCLIVGAQNLKSLFWRITGFTIGHSITISFGFFNIILNYLWFIPFIETTIAISIVYAAFLALWGKEHKNIILITGLIGLLHGFGFSFILSEILSIDSMNLWQSLLGFNVGVEFGQLLIAVIVWPCLWYFGKKFPLYQSHLRWTILLPCILIGSLWVGERAIILINSF